jgi:hypothetical protein
MTDDSPKAKKTGYKRRMPGTSKPPRAAFIQRLEQSTFDRLNAMLESYGGSRNEYVERLIEHDLEYRERIRPLNTALPSDKPRRS